MTDAAVAEPEIEVPPTKPGQAYLKISATQLDTFGGARESCNRKWWFSYVLKLETIQNQSARFGSAFHEVLERWFRADDQGPPAELYPAGWDAGLTPVEVDLVKRLMKIGLAEGLLAREPDREVETGFLFTLIDEPHLRVDVIGYRDLISRRRRIVTDHKTTSNGDYAKTEYTLPRTTQMPLYGISLFLELNKAGETPEELFVEHNVFCTATSPKEKKEGRLPRAWKVGPVPIKVKADPKPRSDGRAEVWITNGASVCVDCSVRYTGASPVRLVPPVRCSHCGSQIEAEEEDREPSLEDALDTFQARARAMAEVAKIQTWTSVPGPLNVQAACNAFGGCPFAGICGGQYNVEDYKARVARANAQGGASRTPGTSPDNSESARPSPSTLTVTQGVPTMSMMALLAGKKPAPNGATTGTTTTTTTPPAPPPAPPQPTPEPAPTPPPSTAATSPLSAQMAGLTSLAAMLKPKPPQVNPNPVPPSAPVTPANPNQVPMPWAVKGCNACTSTGVSTAGNPCMVCEDIALKEGRPISDLFVWTFENGIMSVQAKQGVVVPGATSTVITPTQVVGPPGTQTMAQVLALGNTSPGTDIVVPTPSAETAPPPKKRGRPKKSAEPTQAAVLTSDTTGAPIEQVVGFTLCIGCRPANAEIVQFDALWAEAGALLAKNSNVASFYSLKPFERADRLVEQASGMAELLHGQTVVVPRETTVEQRGLVGALRALAAEVYES